MEDRELLREYIETQSDQAFSELVARHVNLVYSTARRMVGDEAQAKDVAQSVFIDLARKPGHVRQPEALGGWLYRATQYAATQALRAERRRQARETEAMNRADLENDPPAAWEAIEPLLDDALRRLKPVEMNVVVMKFFEGKSLQEAGAALDLSENAAQKRLSRALEKLRAHFARRGVTVSAALLATAITAHSVQAAPAGLAASFTTSALASAGTAVSGTLLNTLYFTMKTKTTILIAAIIAVAAIPVVIEHQKNILLQEQLEALQHHPASAAKGKNFGTSSLPQARASLARILSIPSNTVRLRELIDLAETLDAAGAKSLLDDLAKQPDSQENRLAMTVLLERMVRLDSAAALAWADGVPGFWRHQQALEALFTAWEGVDPVAALNAAGGLSDAGFRKGLQAEVLRSMANYDPQKALEAVQGLPGVEQSRNLRALYDVVFQTWAGNDPAAAAEAVMNLPATRQRVFAIQSVAEGWSRNDPQGQIAWAEKLPGGPVRTSAMNVAVDRLAMQDPSAAIDYVKKLPDNADRNDYFGRVAARWSEQDPAAALAWADENITGATHDSGVAAILSRWSMSDPAAAQNYVAQMPPDAMRDAAISKIGQNWAERDPRAAIAWMQQMSGGSMNNAMVLSQVVNAVNDWANVDPLGAASYVQTFKDQPNFNRLMSQIGTNWASADPDTALNWANSLELADGHDSAVAAIITQMSIRDPQTAWTNAGEMLTGAARNQALSNIITKWSMQNPAQAAPALASLPEGEALNKATSTLATNWVQQNPLAASRWIATLPAGDARDGAVVSLLAAERDNDPSSAFAWAASLGQEVSRMGQLDQVVQAWAKKDPAAAANAIQASAVTDAQKAYLMSALQKAAAK